MSDCRTNSSFLPPIGELDRRAQSQGSQSSTTSLFRTPTFELRKPASNRPHSLTSIFALNDDVLLNIFYLYRLHIEDERDLGGGLILNMWDRQRWWYNLAQVSQQWRWLILSSASRLDLHLLCTYGVPVADMLVHSPPLPLTIFYQNYPRRMTTEDEEGILFALSHRDRIRRIALRMPVQKMGRFFTALDEQFPILDHVYIESQIEGTVTSLILPRTFEAPNLRHIHLWHVALPLASPLLTTTPRLVYLCLGGFPRATYFPPNYLLTRLSLMPQLETLGVRFYSSLPNRDIVRQLLDTPIMAPVVLSNLRVFTFRGVSAYLEGLLARISAPDLSILEVQFFNQLTFTVLRLLDTTQVSQNLKFNTVELLFSLYFVDINLKADSHQTRRKDPVSLKVMCRHFDWQVASAMQILGTLSPVLSVVQQVSLSYVQHIQSSPRPTNVDQRQYRELLRPFSGAKTLSVQQELVVPISRSLLTETGEVSLELLPNLQVLELRYFDGSNVDDACTPFITERKAAGRPVHLRMGRPW